MPQPAGTLQFTQYHQIIQAAVAGQGVALGRVPLVDELLRSKELVAPFGLSRTSAAASRAYFVDRQPARCGPAGGRRLRGLAAVRRQRRSRAGGEAAREGGRARMSPAGPPTGEPRARFAREGSPMNDDRWDAIRRAYRADEAEAVAALTARVRLDDAARRRIAERALALAHGIRHRAGESFGAEAFLRRFGLSSREGVVLMCLAEALLRIPDADTADALIRDKLAGTQWESEDWAPGGLLLNAATWGLMLTGTLTAWADDAGEAPATIVRRLVGRAGEPFVRGAIRQAMKIMAEQFIVGETIEDAIGRAAAARGARLPVLLRHARRGGPHRRATPSAISPPTSRRSTRSGAPRTRGRESRRGRASRSSSRRCIRATRSRRRGACSRELLPRIEALAERAAARGRPGDARRRGVGPPRALARALRAPRAPSRARRLGRAWPRGAGVPEARDPRLRLARRARARMRGDGSWSGS